MIITLAQYFRDKPHTSQHELAAADLLVRRRALREEWMHATGAPTCPVDQDTGCEISGSRGGSGDGGFRLHNATTGKPNSSHKEAKGIDDFDPNDALDRWLDTFEDGKGGNSMLEKHGLYREHPDSTPGWCHLTTRRPGSGKRTFLP